MGILQNSSCIRAWMSSRLSRLHLPRAPPTTPPPRSIEVHRPAHCSTATYLLTTHSTEVAVDEAMYLVETSEAAFTLEVTETESGEEAVV